MISQACHNALSTLTGLGDDRSQIIQAKVRGLLLGYDHRWQSSGWNTLSVEETFQLPVINPETGRESRTFRQAGKVDAIAEHGGSAYLVEHKTTSEDISDPNSTYWRRLAIDSQVSSYVLANWQQGRKLAGTLYDVIRKPGISPKQIVKTDLKTLLEHGIYFGWKVSAGAVEHARQTGAESPALYSMRLARECIDNPQKYFARRVIPRLDDDLLEWAAELWEVGQAILHARNRDAHFRNSGACMLYNQPCEYLGICSGHDSPDSDKWARKEQVHEELPVLEGDGRDVLTHSRIRCFATCRRKHQYRYEIGIVRVDEEEREALQLGSLLHKALETWWLHNTKGSNDGDCNTVPASGVGTEQQAATELAG